jgi:hypothetical protein
MFAQIRPKQNLSKSLVYSTRGCHVGGQTSKLYSLETKTWAMEMLLVSDIFYFFVNVACLPLILEVAEVSLVYIG